MNILGDIWDPVIVRGEHVKIGNDEKALVLILELYSIRQSTNVVAEMELTCRTIPGQDPFFHEKIVTGMKVRMKTIAAMIPQITRAAPIGSSSFNVGGCRNPAIHLSTSSMPLKKSH